MKNKLQNPLLLRFKKCFRRTAWFILLACGLSFSANAQLSVTLQTQPPLCGGASTGSITAIPIGGTSPFTFLWNTGGTTATITNLPAGTYSVTVTDANALTSTITAVLTAPPLLEVDLEVVVCNAPGSMTANVSGGVAPFSYAWDNGEATETIEDLAIGMYCVTIHDANSCSVSSCQSISTPLSVLVETTPVACSTGTGGTADGQTSGGIGPFEYLWDNGETTQTISSLTPGNYTITVTASNTCTASASGTVGSTPGTFSIDLGLTQPTCAGANNGQVDATVSSGGLPPFNYEWSNGETTQTIQSLAPGNYSLTVTDALGCTATSSATLANQSNLSVTAMGVNPTCSGSNNGSVSAFPSNGVTPYSFSWSSGETTQMVSNAGAGTYTVTVADDIGCIDTATVTLIAPTSFTVNVTATNASLCGENDGSVSAVPSGGGSPPFSYIWNNGATSNVLNNIVAGTYIVTVTSSQGCTATGSAIVGQPADLNVSVTGSSLVCGNENNGTLTTEVNYGNPPYLYFWSNGSNLPNLQNLPAGNYTVTVSSVEGCTGMASANIAGSPAMGLVFTTQHLSCFANASGQLQANVTGGTSPISVLWSTGSTSPAIYNLAAGNYSVTLTDALGCTISEAETITQPNPLQVVFTTNGSCGSNGSAVANVSGGTPNYSYLWSNGSISSAIFGLAPGDYSLTVTDANGCSSVQSAEVAAFPLVELTVTSSNTTCNGTSNGTVTTSIDNGTAPFSYNWSNGSTESSQTGLTPGSYSVTVTDDNGCMAFGSAFISMGAGLNVEIDAPLFVCPGETISATAVTIGGTPNYTYLWSNGQTTQEATGLVPGNYAVTVSDPAGCSGSASIMLQEGGGFSVVSTVQNVACFGGNSGSISLDVSGGAPPYTFLWNTGETTPTSQNLQVGAYAVTVSDQSECEQIFTYEISQPSELTVSVETETGTCGGLGAATANVGGGTMGFNYLWSNGSTSSSIPDLPAGSYTVTVTDAAGCIASATETVDVVPGPTCEAVLAQPISSLDGNDGQLTSSVTGGSAPFGYLWSNGQTSPTATDLAAGEAFVTVTDADGCETTCSFTLLNPGRIGDFVWLDENMDGVQSPGELGLPGVEVTLNGADGYGGTVATTTTTDAAGMYLFLVQPGMYELTFAPPNDFMATVAGAGGNVTMDSDVEPTTNTTPFYTIENGEVNMTIDAGFSQSPCENVTDPGAMCCDQTLCGPGIAPAPFLETSPATGGIGDLEYRWMYSTAPGPFDPDTWTVIPSATEKDFAPGPINETTYYVRTARRDECPLYLASAQVAVEVGSHAVAEIGGPDYACVGEPVSFSATTNGAGASYAWTFEGGIPATANTPEVDAVVWGSFGAKTITLAVENNDCISYDTLFTSVLNSPILCGAEFHIKAEANGQTAVEVTWDYPEEDTLGLHFDVEWSTDSLTLQPFGQPDSAMQTGEGWYFEKMHFGPVRGRNLYRVTVTNDQGGTVRSNIVEVLIGEHSSSLVHVYPNPFSDLLKVEIINRFDSVIDLEIVDALGRQVRTFDVPEQGSYFEIETAHFAKGTYFLMVRYDGSLQKVYKLIK